MQQSINDGARSASRRTVLMWILGGVVIVQVVAMTMVMRSQVRSAEERKALDSASRSAVAQCFGADRALDVCARGGAPRKSIEATEVADNAPARPPSDKRNPQRGVLPVGFAEAR